MTNKDWTVETAQTGNNNWNDINPSISVETIEPEAEPEKVSIDEATIINEDGTINIDIDRVAPSGEDSVPLASEESVANTVMNSIEVNYGDDLSEEEMLSLFKLILDNHLTPDKVTNERINEDLPSAIKTEVNKNMFENGIAPQSYYTVIREMLDDIFTQANINANFDTLDEELQKILKMPEITDMYFEESAKNINAEVSEQYEKLIEAGDDEKAKELLEVGKSFNESIDMTMLRNAYDTNSIIRKNVRKKYKRVKNYLDTFDYCHKRDNGKLRMPSIKETYAALLSIAKKNGWYEKGITNEGIDKLITLIYWTFAVNDNKDFMSEVKIYYTLKNITMLNYTGVDNKTEFSENFINNVYSLINYIAEESNYGTNKSKSDDFKC